MNKRTRVIAAATLICSTFTLVAALCTKTLNNACNDDFGATDLECPNPFTEFDMDYEWRTAGPNCDNCTMFFLGAGDKDDCANSGPEFKCEYMNTITWCDGTTDQPYPASQMVTPTVSSGNSCVGS